MAKPYVIAVNAVSGGGKTTLARLLRDALSATLFCFDDFDDTNVHPQDMYAWWERGASLLEFDSPGMVHAVQQAIEDKVTAHVVLDYPFGRDHPNFKDVIDLSVFIDTPFDMALARRVLRDYATASLPADERLANMLDLMEHYLKGRHLYLDTNRHMAGIDLILDGCRTPQQLRDQVLAFMGCE
jgi:uridine kinase